MRGRDGKEGKERKREGGNMRELESGKGPNISVKFTPTYADFHNF